MGGSERTDEDRSVRLTESAPPLSGGIQDFVDGYLVPVDPMDDLKCESCQ